MKKIRSILALTLFVMLALCLFTACGGSGGKGDGFTITFDYNYPDAPADYTITVEEGGVVDPPSDPTRPNYSFDGWFTDEDCNEKADFEYTVTGDATYYAGWTQTSATITFDHNDGNGTVTTATAEIGGTVAQPEAPTRDGYLFTGWFTDKACTTEYAFSTVVSGDVTLYAGWEQATGDTVTVTFEYNYGDEGVYYSQTINSGRRVNAPADPARSGYAFMGWYTDADCTVEYSFTTLVKSDTTLYAKWLAIHTFEAEYVDMTGMVGVGWSSSVEGVGLIDVDNMNGGASGGYYVGYMYVTGNKLTFHITSDSNVSGCVLVLRLTGEGEDFTLTDDEMPITVNGNKVEYDTLEFTGVLNPTDGERRPFSNFVINENITLEEGDNEIVIEIANSKSLGGTMGATAPMFDCMYIYSNADLEWTEGYCHEENLDAFK